MPDVFGRRLWSRLVRMAPVGVATGVHRQARVGIGFDLTGIRPFEPGDDPRRLDAGATARRGFPHVREDRPTPSQALHFVVEGGARLAASPAPSPLDMAHGVISILAPLALACGDPVGMTRLDANGLLHTPPRRDPTASHACLAQLTPGTHSSTGDSGVWMGLVPRGSLALIITDGLSPVLPPQLSALAQRAEVRLLLLRHPWIDESAPPFMPIADPVSRVVLPPPTKAGWSVWRQEARKHMQKTMDACRYHRETACSKDAMALLGELLGELLAGPHP